MSPSKRGTSDREASSTRILLSMATSVSNGTSGNAHGSTSPPPVAWTSATALLPLLQRLPRGAPGAAAASVRRPRHPLAGAGGRSPRGDGDPSLAVIGGSSAGGLSGAGGAQLLGLSPLRGHVAAALGLSGAGGAPCSALQPPRQWLGLQGVAGTPVG